MIEFTDQTDPKYIDIDTAANMVNRKTRTIYDWVRNETVRVRHRSNLPMLVHIDDILRIDADRLKGRRRRPAPPWQRLAN